MKLDANRLYVGDIFRRGIDENGQPCEKLQLSAEYLYKVGDHFVQATMLDCKENLKYVESKIGTDGKVNEPNNNMFLSEKHPTFDGYVLRNVGSLTESAEKIKVPYEAIVTAQKFISCITSLLEKHFEEEMGISDVGAHTPIEIMAEEADEHSAMVK